jgi:hypothetical protein
MTSAMVSPLLQATKVCEDRGAAAIATFASDANTRSEVD